MWMVYTQHNKSELISSCATASTINCNLLNVTVEQKLNYVKYNSNYVLFHILNRFKVDKFLINVCTSILKSWALPLSMRVLRLGLSPPYIGVLVYRPVLRLGLSPPYIDVLVYRPVLRLGLSPPYIGVLVYRPVLRLGLSPPYIGVLVYRPVLRLGLSPTYIAVLVYRRVLRLGLSPPYIGVLVLRLGLSPPYIDVLVNRPVLRLGLSPPYIGVLVYRQILRLGLSPPYIDVLVYRRVLRLGLSLSLTENPPVLPLTPLQKCLIKLEILFGWAFCWNNHQGIQSVWKEPISLTVLDIVLQTESPLTICSMDWQI